MAGEPRDESVACAECGVYGSQAQQSCDATAIEYAYSKHACNALLINLPTENSARRFQCTRCDAIVVVTNLELATS